MLNEVKLIGNVGKDPEIRRTQDGRPVAIFSVATSERWKTKDGEQKERTEWHSIVVWNESLVGVIEKYVKKGSKVYVCGKIQTRKWQDKEGQDRYTTEIVLNGFDAKFLMLGESGGGRREQAPLDESEASKPSPSKSASFDKELDDQIPF